MSCVDLRIYLELDIRRVECRRCGKVKREALAFLADNPFYTKRFAWYVVRLRISRMPGHDFTVRRASISRMSVQRELAGDEGSATVVTVVQYLK